MSKLLSALIVHTMTNCTVSIVIQVLALFIRLVRWGIQYFPPHAQHLRSLAVFLSHARDTVSYKEASFTSAIIGGRTSTVGGVVSVSDGHACMLRRKYVCGYGWRCVGNMLRASSIWCCGAQEKEVLFCIRGAPHAVQL
ncbi:hypothetical protein K439DRAFT_1196657 [Ramaria rubella]|nr:hypothetical protein K439DRAFT_1196657 [Ramaria rubella]